MPEATNQTLLIIIKFRSVLIVM